MELKTLYKILGVTVFCLLMSIGIYIGIDISQKEKEEENTLVVSDIDNIKIYDEEIINEEEKEIDIDVVFKDVYPDCGHTIENVDHYEKTTKEIVSKDIESKDLGYKLVGEQDGMLVYEKVHNGMCMNHYKVCLENDIVVIYRMSETLGDYILYQETEVTRQMLREGIEEQLEKGIIVDDMEELFLLMEDIES